MQVSSYKRSFLSFPLAFLLKLPFRDNILLDFLLNVAIKSCLPAFYSVSVSNLFFLSVCMYVYIQITHTHTHIYIYTHNICISVYTVSNKDL